MSRIKAGILGGGQLGRMLLQAADSYEVETFVMENDEHCPAAPLANHFVKGDIRNYHEVIAFGQHLDVITIEIENVNTDALHHLEQRGIRVIPSPAVLHTIRDKGLQKEFYRNNAIPTSPFVLLENEQQLPQHRNMLPAAMKLRTEGYDGKGVVLLNSPAEFHKAFTKPSVLEKAVDIEKEISVIVARNITGQTAVFPVCEMVFNPQYNLVDYLISPAAISPQQETEAQQIALRVLHAFGSPGIFAVEMFLDKNGNILVNETAPRAHNSGHQTIEGNHCSQYNMQWRMLLNLPPGDASIKQPSLMLNLIGETGHSGPVFYEGLQEVSSMKDVFVHIYGKSETRPGRKMGHVTILGHSRSELIEKAGEVKSLLRVVSRN